MDPVTTIPALGDNYIYLYKDEHGNAFVVDPGESRSVFEALNKHGLNLKAALVTHNHFDHTGGIDELKRKTGCEVIDPDLNDGEIIETCGAEIQIIATPGHTRSSVCYYVQPSDNRSGPPAARLPSVGQVCRAGILFTGDTLFIGGCGRLIGCDARTMWRSLEKIAALPDDTLVYPGHDYTLENYEFASQIAPDNEAPLGAPWRAIQKRLQQIRDCEEKGSLTVPSTIAQEKATNIFLLANTPEIKVAIDMPNATDAEVFAQLRYRKDVFG